MENRKENREKKNIRVRVKDESEIYPAVVTSISKTGMSLKTGHVFPTFKVVDLLVKIGSMSYTIKAAVRWANELPVTKSGNEDEKYEIGLFLQNPPPDYLSHFE